MSTGNVIAHGITAVAAIAQVARNKTVEEQMDDLTRRVNSLTPVQLLPDVVELPMYTGQPCYAGQYFWIMHPSTETVQLARTNCDLVANAPFDITQWVLSVDHELPVLGLRGLPGDPGAAGPRGEVGPQGLPGVSPGPDDVGRAVVLKSLTAICAAGDVINSVPDRWAIMEFDQFSGVLVENRVIPNGAIYYAVQTVTAVGQTTLAYRLL